jgi:hypothetical protein
LTNGARCEFLSLSITLRSNLNYLFQFEIESCISSTAISRTQTLALAVTLFLDIGRDCTVVFIDIELSESNFSKREVLVHMLCSIIGVTFNLICHSGWFLL